MTEKQFIDKAIEGGYREINSAYPPILGRVIALSEMRESFGVIFLDPKAWEAVGKVEGWEYERFPIGRDSYIDSGVSERMHGMIDALIEGKTIEDYLKTL